MDKQKLVKFFFGTDRRTVITVTVMVVLFIIFVPGVSDYLGDRINHFVMLLLGPLVVILLIGLAFRRIFGPVFRVFSPPKKKD